jgi:oligoendopeptidase F
MAMLTRSAAVPESTWKRETTFASWAAWDKQYTETKAALPELKAWSGKLNSASALAEWFTVYEFHAVRCYEVQGFVSWAGNVDSSDPEANSRQGLVAGLLAEFQAAVAFAEPEMIAKGKEILEWSKEPAKASTPNPLAKYHHYLSNLFRLQQHTRSAEVEELLGMVDEPFDTVYRAYSELTNSDLKFEDAVDAAGTPHPVFQSTLLALMQTTDPPQRRTAWIYFYDGYLKAEKTLATLYVANVKQHEFLRKVRGYESVLEMRLAPNNLPTQVFHNLIEVFKANVPVWHRYWRVKAKLLGIEKIAPYDVLAPIVKEPPDIPYRQAVDWICDALQPMGAEYVATLRRGCLEERWVDWVPNIEKRQGAASSRMVGRKPPYIFMSYADNIFSLSTLAHELGHSMHSYAFARHQPIVYNDYGAISSTVTETASNFHQAMTRAYLRKQQANNEVFQLAMVDEAMSNFHRYFFVMPTLARFEYEVYERSKAGKPLTAPIFKEIMGAFFAEGYGDSLEMDAVRTPMTWATFLHLYSPYYTFQYAIGISAAHAAAERILSGVPGAVDGYHAFLAAGGSRYAMELFQMAGVDMSTKAPIEAAFRELEANVSKLEELAS